MIALADCNNFYASCERVFNPKLNDVPVIVLSNNDGCIIARSNEAKMIGIGMGVPFFKVKDIIDQHNVQVFSTNFSLYGDLSRRVMKTISTEVNIMEEYSIDEAFLDFSDFYDIERAMHLKKKVFKWTGIPISIGIAKNKVLAKIANDVAKKQVDSGVFLLEGKSNVDRILSHFPIGDVWGIGRRYTSFLFKFGIRTALDFKNTNDYWVKRNLSIHAYRVQQELKGDICYPLDTNIHRKKSIRKSGTFADTVNDIPSLERIISSYAHTCAVKLRKSNLCCNRISVFLSNNMFSCEKKVSLFRTFYLDVPTNDSIEIIRFSIKGLHQIYSPNIKYKKAGIIVSNCISDEIIQLSCFDSVNRLRNNKVNYVLDYINHKVKPNLVRFAIQGDNNQFSSEKIKKSPNYTTNLKEILKVRI